MKNGSLLFTLILAGIVLEGCPTATTLIDFNNLSSVTTAGVSRPVAVGDIFGVGDILIENTSNTRIVVLPFQWDTATRDPACPPIIPPANGWTPGGYVQIVPAGLAGGNGNEVLFNNASLGVIAPTAGIVKKLRVKFSDQGGNINLIVNGRLVNDQSLAAVAGRPAPQFPNVNMSVTPPGGLAGTLQFSGEMDRYTFPFPCPVSFPSHGYSAVVGGGQEFAIDDLEFTLKLP